MRSWRRSRPTSSTMRWATVHELVRPSENPRLTPPQKQLLDEEIEGKVCVVCRHRPVFDLLLRALTEYDPAWIEGSMKPDEVEEQKAAGLIPTRTAGLFCCRPRRANMVIPYWAGQGRDDKCRTMIFFENSYSAPTPATRSKTAFTVDAVRLGESPFLYIDLSGSDLDQPDREGVAA